MNDQSTQIPQEARTFLESLLQDAGMVSLDAEMQEEMVKELYVRLDNFIASQLVENLPPDKMETFIQMNEEKKSKEEVEQFIKNAIPNAQEIFAKAFMEFRSLYLGNVAIHKNAPPAAPIDSTSTKTN